MNKKYNPIALYTYNRPKHTINTIEALKLCRGADKSILYVFSDAAKDETEKNNVQQVREYLKTVTGFAQVIIKEQGQNIGLRQSIYQGNTYLAMKYDAFIVLEDDLIVHKSFLDYMNKALNYYRMNTDVLSVSGYAYINFSSGNNNYFSRLTCSWGWATWSDRWNKFIKEESLLEKALNKFDVNYINYGGSYNFVNMAVKAKNKKLSSWAVDWYLFGLINQSLTLYPNFSLVSNQGFDGSGVNCNNDSKREKLIDINTEDFVENYPSEVRELLHIEKILEKSIETRNRKYFRLFRFIFLKLKFYSLKRLKMVKNFVKKIIYIRKIGINSTIDCSVHVTGWKHLFVGDNVIISEGTWLNVNKRIKGKINIIIEDNTYIGKYNFFSSGNVISVGPFCMTGIGCRFLGANHTTSDVYKPYISTPVTDNASIRLGSNVWLGSDVTIVGNINIGKGSIVGAGSLVTTDLPDFCVAVGRPAKVVKRYDFTNNTWVKTSSTAPCSEAPTDIQYLEALKNNNRVINMPIFASGKSMGDVL